MISRIIETESLMRNVCREYDRKATKEGLRLAWIEKAVNDTPTVSPTPGSGWVSVENRLPEDSGFVIVFIENGRAGNVHFMRCIEIASYDPEDGGWMLEHFPHADANITHWMDPADPLGRPRATIDDLVEEIEHE